MDLWSHHTIFYQADPHFGVKLISCVAILTRNVYVYGCRLHVYHFQVNITL